MIGEKHNSQRHRLFFRADSGKSHYTSPFIKSIQLTEKELHIKRNRWDRERRDFKNSNSQLRCGVWEKAAADQSLKSSVPVGPGRTKNVETTGEQLARPLLGQQVHTVYLGGGERWVQSHYCLWTVSFWSSYNTSWGMSQLTRYASFLQFGTLLFPQKLCHARRLTTEPNTMS